MSAALSEEAVGIGALIREARERKGVSQNLLALALGVTQTAVSYWEAGKRDPGASDLLRIAHALDTDAARLLPMPRVLAPGEFVSDLRIAETLLEAFPVSRALAEAVAEIVAQVITANEEARRAWDQAGRQAEAKVTALRERDEARQRAGMPS